jgi:hypothetical protein
MLDKELILQHYFDPNRNFGSVDDALIHRRNEVVGNVAINGVQAQAEELVVAEAAHLGVELSPGRLMALGLKAFNAANIVHSVETAVDHRITDVLSGVELLRRRTPQAAFHSDIVLAGMVTAEWAHAGVRRQDGREYYTHPATVAAIIEKGWELSRGQKEMTPSDQARLDRLLFVAYNHDAFEDALPGDNTSFLSSSSFLVSPLLVRRLFKELGREDDGERAASTLLELTKTRQGTEKISQANYEKNLTSDPDAAIVKLADTQHNGKLDPKGLDDLEQESILRNIKRKRNYKDMQYTLLHALENSSSDDLWLGHTISGFEAPFIAPTGSTSHIRPALFLDLPESQ